MNDHQIRLTISRLTSPNPSRALLRTPQNEDFNPELHFKGTPFRRRLLGIECSENNTNLSVWAEGVERVATNFFVNRDAPDLASQTLDHSLKTKTRVSGANSSPLTIEPF